MLLKIEMLLMPFMIIQKVLDSIYHDYNDNSTTGHYREDRGDDGDFYTNSQVKANMLLAFVKNEPELKRQENDQYEEDRAMQAIGLSAGYVNLIATQLGYSTGCCKCMDSASITNILGDTPILLMGVVLPTRQEIEENITIIKILNFHL